MINGRVIAPSASPEEAAAIVAALERFMRATARPPRAAPQAAEGWRRVAAARGASSASRTTIRAIPG